MTQIFEPGRNRDAWAVLRGYLYQVHVTLDRWLRIQDGEVLELERGEDIDLLGRATAARGQERVRLLEQVKHLEKSVTLRSGGVRAFLANAFSHRNENPALALRFRFTTTAKPGTEQRSAMPGKVPGIEAWEGIRDGTWRVENLEDALGAIRKLLLSTRAPAGVSGAVWKPFQAFVRAANGSEFEEFVRAFEWSTQQGAADDYPTRLQEQLVAMGFVEDLAGAEPLYDRLVVLTLRRLTKVGAKRLTREGLLEQVDLWRAGTLLSPDDSRRVQDLREIVVGLESRLGVVESSVTELQSIAARSADLIEELAQGQGISASVEYLAMMPVLEEPPLVERASHRHQTVEQILGLRRKAAWIALHGVSGSGKSQLALLLARTVAKTRAWIRFRDLTIPQACVRYDAAITALAHETVLDGRGSAVPPTPGPALERLGKGAVVVLDDLPQHFAGDELSVRLVSLVRAAGTRDVLVISTAHHPIPSRAIDMLGSECVLVQPAPPFSLEEVVDVLSEFGAPDAWKQGGAASLVHTVTGGHATLVRACARDLSTHGWTKDTAFARVLGTQFAAEVNEETIRALLTSTPDAESRELLFRLNLIDGEFGLDEVSLLAAVPRPIRPPRTRFAPLLGLWVETDAGQRYAVSPLVRPLGGSELTPETCRECHLALARQIVSRSVIGEIEATRALTHFTKAEAYDSAAWVLIRGLISLRESGIPPGKLPAFAHIWIDVPLPERMDLGLRLQIRALQLGLSLRSGRNATYVRDDIERLSRRVEGRQQWVAFGAFLFAAEAFSSVDVVAAAKYLSRALRLRSTLAANLEDRGPAAPDLPIEQMVWMLTMGIDSADALLAWMDVFEEMAEEERVRAFEDKVLAQGGAQHATNQLITRERAKDEYERDWDGVLEALESLTDRAQAIGVDVLSDAAIMSRMAILAEVKGDLQAAEALSDVVLERADLDPAWEFVITNTRAVLLYDYGAKEEAIRWLERAFTLRTAIYGWQSVRAGIYLSIRLAESDTERALAVLAEAVNFAEEHPHEVGHAGIEVQAELGVAEWLAGDWSATFNVWDRAATLLLNAKDDSVSWKSLFVAFGHVTGYFMSMATSGTAPPPLEDGEPYTAPRRGIFTLRPEGRDTAYVEERLPILPVQLTQFAQATGADDRAVVWARAAESVTRNAGWYPALALVLPILVADAVRDADYEQAIDLARERWAIWEATRLRGATALMCTEPPQKDLGPDGGAAWLPAESRAMLVLVPIYLHLARLWFTDPASARRRLRTLSNTLRQQANRAARPDAWIAAAQLFDDIFMANVSDVALVGRANEFDFGNEFAAGALKAVAYLGASTRGNVSPEQSLSLQLGVAPYVDQAVLTDARFFAETAGAFFGLHWRRRFHDGRFRFSDPSRVERRFEHADAQISNRAQLVLAAVVDGLGVRVPDQVRDWLGGGKPAG